MCDLIHSNVSEGKKNPKAKKLLKSEVQVQQTIRQVPNSMLC